MNSAKSTSTALASILRKRLRAGEELIGIFNPYREPMFAELLAKTGFDFAIFDGEHGLISESDMPALVLAAEQSGCCPLVRTPSMHPRVIGRHLDFGAQGVVAPMINTKDQAAELLSSCLYPPEGARGLAYTRSLGFGLDGSVADAMVRSNRDVLTVAQVETRLAMENLPDILQLERLDMIFVGPADLSVSLGVPLQFDHPKFVQALASIAAQTLKAGKYVGVLIGDPQQIGPLRQMGFRFYACYADTLIASAGRDLLTTLRA